MHILIAITCLGISTQLMEDEKSNTQLKSKSEHMQKLGHE